MQSDSPPCTIQDRLVIVYALHFEHNGLVGCCAESTGAPELPDC